MATSASENAGGRLPEWAERLMAGPLFALLLTLLVLAGGTAGYVLVEGWGAWDAFYMTVITVTTVGYREIHDLSLAGQAFTILLLVGGVGTAFYTFSMIAALVVEGGLRARLDLHRRERMLDDLTGHYIVCGFGRIGAIVVDEFIRHRVPFVVIERDAERVHQVMESGGLAVEADASREEVLMRVGITRARGLVAAVGTDAENVYTVLTAKLLRPDLFIVGRAETDDARRKLMRAGADRVISPYQIGGVQMALTAMRPAVVDFVQLATGSSNLDLMMEQVRIEPGASLAGKSIVDAGLRQRFGVIVVGVQRADGSMQFNPPADAVMQPGDQLVVLGKSENLKELERAAK